jgi:hypothetical protein
VDLQVLLNDKVEIAGKDAIPGAIQTYTTKNGQQVKHSVSSGWAALFLFCAVTLPILH